jgi:hypothetical protein
MDKARKIGGRLEGKRVKRWEVREKVYVHDTATCKV